MIHWQDLHHTELTVQQLYAILQLRCAVFVVEQQCPYQDVDGDDLTGENRHLLGWHNDRLVAYARILKSDDDLEPVVIGRDAVASILCSSLAAQGEVPERAGASATFLRALWFRSGDGYL